MPQQSVPTSKPAAPTTTEPTQQARAEAIWRLFRDLDSIEKRIEQDFAMETVAVNEAKAAHDRAKAGLRDALDRHPLTVQVKRLQDELATAKAQFANSYQVGDPKTVETAQGDKVQVRGGEVVSITDHAAVARTLLDKDLWQAAGATVSANQDFLATLVGNGVLADAASVEKKFTVALISRKC